MGTRVTLVVSLSSVCSLVFTGWMLDAQSQTATAARQPDAVLDLMTQEGVAQLQGEWRYSDVEIVEVSSARTEETIASFSEAAVRGGGGIRPDVPQPERQTYDIQPHAGAVDFDDSAWSVVDPASLPLYRSGGQLCFGWYRITMTMPESVGGVQTAGATAVLVSNADDYGEVWIQGQLPRSLRGPNPNLITGWNSTARITLSETVTPGEQVQVAIFAINGPISATPANRVFMREAKVEFIRN